MKKDKFLNIDIKSATYVDKYSIAVSFSDGKKRTLDFYPYLSKAEHPAITKLLVLSNFKRFKVDKYKKDLYWGDFDVVFNIGQLYRNRIWEEAGELII